MSRETLNQFIRNHSLAKQMREYKSDVVWGKFSNWLKAKPSSDDWHNSLYRFASEYPFYYLDDEIIADTLKALNQDIDLTLEILNTHSDSLSRAIFAFLRSSSSWQIQDNERISIHTPTGIEDFENIWHPEYVKYCEQVYNHLIKVPLSILGKQKQKDYISLALSLRADKLKELAYPSLTDGYNSTVRNAISHGGVEYGIAEIRYIDAKDTQEIYAPDVTKLLDDLFDTCASIIASLMIFVSENRQAIEKTGIEKLPMGIIFLLVEGFASHSTTKLLSFIESGKDKKQLNIKIKTDSTSRGVHQLESLQVTWAACHFGGKRFNRFAISIDCNKPVEPLAIINGEILSKAIESDALFDEVAPMLFEHSLLWYDASKLSFRVNMLHKLLVTNWEIQKRNFRLEMIQKRNFIPRLHYRIAYSKNTSPQAFRRLEAVIVLDVSKEIDEDDLIKIIRSAINRLRRRLIRRKDLNGEFGAPGFPFFINLKVCAANRRIRRLLSYTLQDTELVAIAEFSKNWKKFPPAYTKQATRDFGRIRIKYNTKLIRN